ncbi:carbohydate-binding domain-containing protein [Photobacterium phosphoreum]|uniref:carbohydate-binding domain-containing protein n=1 Tax=Photobacterium phosphoreum TaxID=659 RepID=UPI000D16382D|nr:carbohydate-binding domain-containing protein [Photobacterium phosphoreum]PTB32027.1 hypothetical protein DAT36_14015 [Photobacterium phosphoreum]
MNLKLTLLASSVMLASMNVHALTQSDIDYAAKHIKLTTGLVENKPQDCPPESPLGYCYRVEIELENTGKRELNKDAEIYFSSYHRSLGSKSDEFNIEHINSDLHKLTTTDSVKGCRGQTEKLNIDFMNWIVSESDFFPNYLPDNIPANVEWMSDRMGSPISAVTGEKKRDFIGVQVHFGLK